MPVNVLEPLVSVITPTYNHEQFIAQCIQSVCDQSYTNWEQIVIDDGSCDRTRDIVSSFRDRRIHYHVQENLGPFRLAETYNRALKLAKGELIAILEGDDFWPVEKLSCLVPAFANPEVVLAYGERDDVDEAGKKQRNKTAANRLRATLAYSVLFNNPLGSATRYMFLAEGRSLVGPCTVIIRRKALEAIGGFQEVTGLPLTDYPTFLTLSLAGRFYYSPKTMGYFRRHSSSITNCHARTIHDTVSQFTREFIEAHADAIPLLQMEQAHLESNWDEASRRLHFSEGRLLLVRQQWFEARRQLRIATTSNSVKVKTAAMAAIGMSYLHLNIERLMALGGKSAMNTVASNSRTQS